MKNVSWRKFSLLGLTLIAASAVTAAFVKDDKKPTNLNGSLTFNFPPPNGDVAQTNDGGNGTCTVSTAEAGQSCDATSALAGSGTTAEDNSITNPQTANNTTAAN